MGAWAKPACTRVTVPAHGKVTVPFTLRVPADAEPGDDPGAGRRRSTNASTGATAPSRSACNRPSEHACTSASAGPSSPRSPSRTSGSRTTSRSSPDSETAPRRSPTPSTAPATSPSTKWKAWRARGLFGRTLLARDLARVPAELLPGQRVRLSEPWRGAPQLDWGDVTLTASAQDTRESASASFFALPWLLAALLAVALPVGVVLLIRARRARARLSVPVPPSQPAAPTPSRPRSSPSARP
ncbi:hypothetical protein SALBM311S_04318 [Streptomyces alboniger]